VGSAVPDPISVKDGSNATYTLLATVNDQPDWQAVMAFARANVPAGSVTAHAHFVGLEWQALLVVEVANVSPSPVIAAGVGLTTVAPTSANSVSSGVVAVASSAALVLGFGMNGSDQNGAPTVGTGFSSLATVWNWNGAEGTSRQPSSLLEYASFTGPGNVAATFTPVAANENFCSLVVAVEN
jgi:hypothetical protein